MHNMVTKAKAKKCDVGGYLRAGRTLYYVGDPNTAVMYARVIEGLIRSRRRPKCAKCGRAVEGMAHAVVWDTCEGIEGALCWSCASKYLNYMVWDNDGVIRL